mmetsp:Transcript_133123/g.385116  ORF Transcript_133123/g.385116 Transcript_133123/m.385116 type:complete len:208 (-) Transcript_133123:101-724(-)
MHHPPDLLDVQGVDLHLFRRGVGQSAPHLGVVEREGVEERPHFLGTLRLPLPLLDRQPRLREEEAELLAALVFLHIRIRDEEHADVRRVVRPLGRVEALEPTRHPLGLLGQPLLDQAQGLLNRFRRGGARVAASRGAAASSAAGAAPTVSAAAFAASRFSFSSSLGIPIPPWRGPSPPRGATLRRVAWRRHAIRRRRRPRIPWRRIT